LVIVGTAPGGAEAETGPARSRECFAAAGADGTKAVSRQIALQYLRNRRFILHDENETVVQSDILRFFRFPFGFAALGRTIADKACFRNFQTLLQPFSGRI